MHYDRTCGCTQGLLLADYLKALLTGDNLPGDLAEQARNSPLLRAAASGGPVPVATSFANAFVQGAGSVSALSTTPDPAVLPVVPVKPNALPPPVSSPDFGLSMFLWGQPQTTDRDLKIASGADFHWQKTLFQWRDIEGKAKGVFD